MRGPLGVPVQFRNGSIRHDAEWALNDTGRFHRISLGDGHRGPRPLSTDMLNLSKSTASWCDWKELGAELDAEPEVHVFLRDKDTEGSEAVQSGWERQGTWPRELGFERACGLDSMHLSHAEIAARVVCGSARFCQAAGTARRHRHGIAGELAVRACVRALCPRVSTRVGFREFRLSMMR